MQTGKSKVGVRLEQNFIPRAGPQYVVVPKPRSVIGRQASGAEFNVLANPQLVRPLGRKRGCLRSHGGPSKPELWKFDPVTSKVRM